jgi:hypothetical protein
LNLHTTREGKKKKKKKTPFFKGEKKPTTTTKFDQKTHWIGHWHWWKSKNPMDKMWITSVAIGNGTLGPDVPTSRV